MWLIAATRRCKWLHKVHCGYDRIREDISDDAIPNKAIPNKAAQGDVKDAHAQTAAERTRDTAPEPLCRDKGRGSLLAGVSGAAFLRNRKAANGSPPPDFSAQSGKSGLYILTGKRSSHSLAKARTDAVPGLSHPGAKTGSCGSCRLFLPDTCLNTRSQSWLPI